MDERLEAGRHHLTNGSRALDQGYPDDARAFYRAALLQFRGPELRLGEAHALRGLARVELQQGRDGEAAALAESAVRAYEDLLAFLHDIDPEGVSDEIRRGAFEGEAAAEILAAEIDARAGASSAAEEHLERARVLAASVRSTALSGDVETAMGRLALRHGYLSEARDRFEEAARLQREAGNGTGEAGVLLLLAEACRLAGDVDTARWALDQAAALATSLRSDRMAGRVAWTRAALDLGNEDLVAAKIGFEAAIPVLHRAGDFDMEAHALLGLAEVNSRRGEPGVRPRLLEAATRLGGTGDAHGVATVFLLAAEHAMRAGQNEMAALLAEGARRGWVRTDPVRGAGQALRVLARALVAAGRPRTALWVALAREVLAGHDQPGAAAVARWHLDRASPEEADEAAACAAPERVARAEEAVAADLAPILDRMGLPLEALDRPASALTVLEVLVGRLPEAAPSSPAPPIPPDHPPEREQPTGAFVALGALRAGKGGTPSPAPTRGAYPPRSDEEGGK